MICQFKQYNNKYSILPPEEICPCVQGHILFSANPLLKHMLENPHQKNQIGITFKSPGQLNNIAMLNFCYVSIRVALVSVFRFYDHQPNVIRVSAGLTFHACNKTMQNCCIPLVASKPIMFATVKSLTIATRFVQHVDKAQRQNNNIGIINVSNSRLVETTDLLLNSLMRLQKNCLFLLLQSRLSVWVQLFAYEKYQCKHFKKEILHSFLTS